MESEKVELSCKTCGKPVSKNYCSNCGEKVVASKISFKNFISEILSEMMSFEAPLFYTLKQLALNPGMVPKRYISGNRKVFTKPFAFFFLMLGGSYLLSIWIINPEEMVLMIEERLADNMEVMKQFGNENLGETIANATKMQEKMKELNFLIIPFISFFSWLFFRKSGYNLLENIVLFFYLNGFNFIFSMITTLLCLFSLEVIFYTGNVVSIVSTVYLIWGMVVFHNQKTVVGVFKAIGVFIISMALFAFAFTTIYARFS